jgi:CheY-like chemotaxis protein
VAHPQGCLKCGETGYQGREGVYEVIEFNAEIAEMVRENAPIPEIRAFAAQVDNFLIGNHAVEKVRSLTLSPVDVYEKVLVEEERIKKPSPKKTVTKAVPPKTKTRPSVLVVDDDTDTRRIVAHLLKNRGCDVTASDDGISALINLAQKHFDLIISDINMPNLDGFKLLEMINQKGINTPVIFLTGRTRVEDEMRGLSLGAMDYLKKPVKKDVFLLRVKKVLAKIQERKKNSAARPDSLLQA